MSDLYSILGCARTASKDEIKSAYKKLALQHHPDRGGNEEEFKKISKAYTILSDDEKRKRYDITGSADEHPQPQPQGHPFGFNPFQFMGDIFQQNRNRQRQQTRKPPTKAEDLNMTLKITLEQAYFGCTKQIKIGRQNRCGCESDCVSCHGSGQVIQQMQNGPFIIQNTVPCRNCVEGVVSDIACSICKGSGFVDFQKQIDVVIPRFVDTAYRCTVSGMGHPGKRKCDSPGDLHLAINIEPHGTWKVDGPNFRTEVTIDLWDSVCGKVVSIPHFDGEITVDTKTIGIIPHLYEHKIPKKGFKPEGNCIIKFLVKYEKPTPLSAELLEKCNSVRLTIEEQTLSLSKLHLG
jgi:DnaJ-class molecular chaperone